MNAPSAAASIVNGIANTICGTDKAEFELSMKPVWLLGILYDKDEELSDLQSDIRSRLWFTYRKGFKKIGDVGPDTDRGWGCMLRCGQMILAQALVVKHLGRSWRWTPDDDRHNKKYLDILNLFADKKSSTYSIHQIALMRNSENTRIDEWFGPNSIAQTLRKLSEYDEQNRLVIHVALDNLVTIDKISTVWSTEPERDLVLFIPLRLGLYELNPVYYEALKNSFKLSNTLGIIGGKPGHALYFIGYSDQELICLDPHTTQLYTEILSQASSFSWSSDSASSAQQSEGTQTYHSDSASKIPISQLDPSVALCFYFNSAEQFDQWCAEARKLLIDEVEQPMFEICKGIEYYLSSDLIDFDSADTETLLTDRDSTGSEAEARLARPLSSPTSNQQQQESDEDFEILAPDIS